MQEQPRNRDWVKNAAIIFLVVLLVLTFFSNTIMNRSLPEVATQEVESGSIVARVRGTGTVQANSNTQVKMDRTRVIRSVLVKVGQKVEAGDVLFTLGEGASEEIDAAEETLRNLQASYNRTAATMPEYNYSTDTRKIGILSEKLAEAESAWKNAEAKKLASVSSDENLKIIQGELERAVAAREAAEKNYNGDVEALQEWKEKQDSVVPAMVTYGMLDGDLISSSSEYTDRSRIETQISRVKSGETEKTYTIFFYNNDKETALYTAFVGYNVVPTYAYGTPTSVDDTATKTYPFLRWVDSAGNPIAPATEDTTYYAEYSKDPVPVPTAEDDVGPSVVINTNEVNINTGDVTTGDVTTGDVTTGDVTTGDVTTGDVTTGDVTTGDVTTGGVTTDDVTTGDVTTGVTSSTVTSSAITEAAEEEAAAQKTDEKNGDNSIDVNISSFGTDEIDNLNAKTTNQLMTSGEGLKLDSALVVDENENPVIDEQYEIKAQEETSPQTRESFIIPETHNTAKRQNNHSDWSDHSDYWLDYLYYCLEEYNKYENEIFKLQTTSVEEYESALEAEIKWSNLYDEYMETITPEGANAKARYEAYRTAKDNYDTAVEAYHDKKATNETTLAGYNADLANLWGQIQRAQKKLDDLLGGEEATITARVAGTIQTLDASPGDTKKKDDVIATIEAPDMGYTMSFSVTNDQANRLRVGDTGTVSNFYWGSEITATLRSIQIDQKNPQTNKLLTFDLSGNVTTGTELTVSVGQKSANYDVIIPSSSVRTDANGTYVLKLESKNSPLGNRYLARRVPVEVLAVDDTNSAVSADLGYGDYVITSSSSPLKNGQLVRLATSG